MQATERKHKHKASDKTCFKHISNQKSSMQTCWFWWLIKLKRILLFSDLSWSNWKEFSYLVGVSWWSPSTSQLIISFNLLGSVLNMASFTSLHGYGGSHSVDHLLQLHGQSLGMSCSVQRSSSLRSMSPPRCLGLSKCCENKSRNPSHF